MKVRFPMNIEKIVNNLVNFLRLEVSERGFNNVVVGLSGGVDSAVVALLCQRAFGSNLKVFLLPSDTSSQSSRDDALELVNTFSLDYDIISIGSMLQSYPCKLTPLRRGNMAARLRMLTLFDQALANNALVVGTSNRSEILLGYGTLYGDTACSLNPIGSFYKTEVYQLARYLGVTNAILTKAPTADLWEGQSDEVELGFTYTELDEVMKKIFDEKISSEELLKQGYSYDIIECIMSRYTKNRFKGELPPIAPRYE